MSNEKHDQKVKRIKNIAGQVLKCNSKSCNNLLPENHLLRFKMLMRADSNETKQSKKNRTTKTSKTKNSTFSEMRESTSKNNCYELKLQTIFL